MKALVIHTAYFTTYNEKKASITALGIRLSDSDGSKEKIWIDKSTYGRMWLIHVKHILEQLSEMISEPVELRFVSGQIQCSAIAQKIEKVFCTCLSDKIRNRSDIEHLVYVASRWQNKPNNPLYVDVIELLLQMHDAQRVHMSAYANKSKEMSQLWSNTKRATRSSLKGGI